LKEARHSRSERKVAVGSGRICRGVVTGVKRKLEKEKSKIKKVRKKETKVEMSQCEGTTVGGVNIQVDLYSLAGCLVEDEDVALAKKCPGKTEELFLSV
jgi:hypothetical protein